MSRETTAGPLAKFRDPDGRIPFRTRWIIAGVILALVIFTSVAGVFWAVIAALGFASLVFGLLAIVTGSARILRIRSRGAGTLALFVGVVALLVGSVGQGVVHEMSNTTLAGTASGLAASVTAVNPTAKPSASTKPKPIATPTPVATQAEMQEITTLPFGSVTVDDESIDLGASAVTVSGGNGEKVTTYLVKYIDGVEVSRTVAREETTLQPIDEVTSIGTRVPEPVAAPAPVAESNGCDPNYADACVPIAPDVDCAGGSGNGPAYVEGPVRIVGSDIYDLDRDGDGIACDA